MCIRDRSCTISAVFTSAPYGPVPIAAKYLAIFTIFWGKEQKITFFFACRGGNISWAQGGTYVKSGPVYNLLMVCSTFPFKSNKRIPGYFTLCPINLSLLLFRLFCRHILSPILTRKPSFIILSVHSIPKILLQDYVPNASILFLSWIPRVQVSLPYKATLQT